jgi:hypothetical protein
MNVGKVTVQEVNVLMSLRQDAGQTHNIRTANRHFENMSKFIYLVTTARNQNFVHEEIQSRLNSGTDCYHSLQNLLSSRLLSKNVKIEIQKTTILPTILNVCETCFLTLRKEHRLREFEDRVLRRISGLKRGEIIRYWRKLHNEVIHTLYPLPNIVRII